MLTFSAGPSEEDNEMETSSAGSSEEDNEMATSSAGSSAPQNLSSQHKVAWSNVSLRNWCILWL